MMRPEPAPPGRVLEYVDAHGGLERWRSVEGLVLLASAAVEMYVSLKPGFAQSDDIAAKVIAAIEQEIGKIARPKNVWIVADMPKTRSGKIMRRVIAAISNFADVGDTTTLSNPEIVADIRHHVQGEKVARGDVPRELSAQEQAEITAFGSAE